MSWCKGKNPETCPLNLKLEPEGVGIIVGPDLLLSEAWQDKLRLMKSGFWKYVGRRVNEPRKFDLHG
jgi:hypothetical protein